MAQTQWLKALWFKLGSSFVGFRFRKGGSQGMARGVREADTDCLCKVFVEADTDVSIEHRVDSE